jgi:hypothetical protein
MENFVEKTFEETEAMTAKELFEYRTAEIEHRTKEIVANAEASKAAEVAKENPDAERIAKMEKTIEALKTDAIETALRFKKITEKGDNYNDANDALTELKNNMDTIKTLAKQGQGEVVIKADLVRSAIANNTQAQDVAGIGQLGSRKLTMYDLFRKVPMGTNNNGTLRYWDWDSATTVRAAEMRAENTLFPESTATFQEYTLTLKKIGDTLPVSAEFFEDEAMFAAELANFLITNVALIMDYQICYGAGTGTNLTGLFTTATAFAPSTVTHVEQPTIYDLLKSNS